MCARAKDASLLFICEMTFNSDDGEISPWNFFGGRPAGYYFVGRLTNDYAGATFAKTKKTLSLNHKEPLPEARTRHIIHGHLDEGFALGLFRGFPAAICQALPLSRPPPSSASLTFIYHLLPSPARPRKILSCLSSS